VNSSAPLPPALSKRFHRLFEHEFAYVCRALQRLGVRRTDLKDVAQELLIAVYIHLEEFDESRPVRPWLFGFALRYAQNYRRLAMHTRVSVGSEQLVHEKREGAELEARDTVLRALEGLDYDQRVVLVMHDLEGFAVPEIAEHVSTNVNTVYSRLRLARERFRRLVLAEAGKDAP
jgi:RNA polymerase sigma-70 factor (ECF subfamily)